MPKGIAKNPEEKSRRISISKIGKKRKSFSDEWRKNLSKSSMRPCKEETKEKLRKKRLGMKFDRKWKDNIKKNHADFNKEKNPRWIDGYGTTVDSLHKKAFDLFGQPCCEFCGISNEEHIKQTGKRLHMHYTLEPHDWKIMNINAWMTVCNLCHQKEVYK